MLKRILIDRKGLRLLGLEYSDPQLARMENETIEVIVDGKVVIKRHPDAFPHRVWMAVIEHRSNKPFWPHLEVLAYIKKRGVDVSILEESNMPVIVEPANDNNDNEAEKNTN